MISLLEEDCLQCILKQAHLWSSETCRQQQTGHIKGSIEFKTAKDT